METLMSIITPTIIATPVRIAATENHFAYFEALFALSRWPTSQARSTYSKMHGVIVQLIYYIQWLEIILTMTLLNFYTVTWLTIYLTCLQAVDHGKHRTEQGRYSHTAAEGDHCQDHEVVRPRFVESTNIGPGASRYQVRHLNNLSGWFQILSVQKH